MDIKNLYDLYLKNRIVSTDSRNITSGCIFFALKGDTFNGNIFAPEAIEKGALAAVVDEGIHRDNKIIKVDNVLAALQELARYHRMQSGIPVLAITGSNGKTTTKELCNAVLSTSFKVHATHGNLNNHIGVPLTLLSMGSDTQLAIIEMGANHPGEIRLLCDIARPDFGLITNVGKAHLEGFGGIQGVARAKGELFQFLTGNDKTIFLNEGNLYLTPMIPADYPKVIRYNGNHSLRILHMTSDPLLSVKAGNGTDTLEINTNLAGSYNAENVLAACCIGIHFGINTEIIVRAIQSYQPQNNRSQLIKTASNTVFMDAYNANPSSMSAAIREFLQLKAKRKMLILGEMREVGASAEKEHQEIIELLQQQNVKNVICVGKAFDTFAEKAGYQHAASVEILCQTLKEKPLTGYFIFVKGSRSNHLEKVIPLL